MTASTITSEPKRLPALPNPHASSVVSTAGAECSHAKCGDSKRRFPLVCRSNPGLICLLCLCKAASGGLDKKSTPKRRSGVGLVLSN